MCPLLCTKSKLVRLAFETRLFERECLKVTEVLLHLVKGMNRCVESKASELDEKMQKQVTRGLATAAYL